MNIDKNTEEPTIFWRDTEGDYHAYDKKKYKKPVVSEKEGTWQIRIELKKK